ncbi:unnamed protein product [Candida verbasci]|uniref:Uncharacterized protein n=1 Tax=Candida verbasci TaxID=1227364 RepID=A0A9W4X8W6_9ASCO|nr:unnamed protein product [Candida verbasci]
MKYTSIATLLSIVATSLAKDIELYIKSDNDEVNNKGLGFIHEGAGINYAQVGDAAQNLNYNEETQLITEPVTVNGGAQTLDWPFGIDNGILQISVTINNPPKVTIGDDGSVSFEGSDSLYAKKNINDPYRYSEKSYFVVSENGDGAIPIKLVAKTEGSNNSTNTNNSTTSTTSAASSVSVIEGGAAVVNAGSFAAIAAAAVGLML